MQKSSRIIDRSQNGNTLLIMAVVFGIVGLLLFFQSQSGKDSAAQKERDLIAASQIVQFPSVVQDTIETMMQNGASPAELNFTNEPNNEDKNEVFGLAGGKLEFRAPPPPLHLETEWAFKTLSDKERGYFVKNVGINDAVSGREILAYLNDIPLNVCEMLRKGLDQDPTPTVEAARVDFKLNDGVGDNVEAGDNAATFDSMPGALFSCVQNGKGQYVYYHVLTTQLNWNEGQE